VKAVDVGGQTQFDLESGGAEIAMEILRIFVEVIRQISVVLPLVILQIGRVWNKKNVSGSAWAGNTKCGSITVLFISCLTGLDSMVQ
jgi:hypothetical protein